MCKEPKKESKHRKAAVEESILISEALNTVLAQYTKEKLVEGKMSPDQVLVCVFSALCKVQMQVAENLIIGKAMKEGDFDTVFKSMTTSEYHPSINKAMAPLVAFIVGVTGATVGVLNEDGELEEKQLKDKDI